MAHQRLRLEFFTQATPIFQSNWRWCQTCEGLFFHGNPTDGTCPGGGPHDPRNSGNYQILVTGGAVFVKSFGLAEFLWCSKCEGMWMIAPSPLASSVELGVCPRGGIHSATGSGKYQIQSE